jgi:hypothetical protein
MEEGKVLWHFRDRIAMPHRFQESEIISASVELTLSNQVVTMSFDGDGGCFGG